MPLAIASGWQSSIASFIALTLLTSAATPVPDPLVGDDIKVLAGVQRSVCWVVAQRLVLESNTAEEQCFLSVHVLPLPQAAERGVRIQQLFTDTWIVQPQARNGVVGGNAQGISAS